MNCCPGEVCALPDIVQTSSVVYDDTRLDTPPMITKSVTSVFECGLCGKRIYGDICISTYESPIRGTRVWGFGISTTCEEEA